MTPASARQPVELKTLAEHEPLPDAERRHLTVVFCDLVESTALGEQLDPEDLGELIVAYHGACAEVIERLHGHVAQYQGDGVLAYFGYPHAHGHDAVHAVRAGLELIQAVGALSAPHLENGEVRLAARVGIDTGVVVVSEMGAGERRQSLAVGDTVNMAARLEKLADPGTVVVSAATERVTRGYFVFARKDAVQVKGIAAPINVYCVADDTGIRTRLALAAATGLTPLVGREQELEAMEERWRLACEGTGQAVLVTGEPGIGKSRVVHELGRRIGDEGTRAVFQASPYYSNSALHPVIEELGRMFRIDGTGGDEGSLARLTEELEAQGVSVEATRPALASLLSIAETGIDATRELAPQEQKRQTFAALRTLMAAEARRHPVLAVFEDIHWADPSTLELLGLLLADAPTQRILIVMTARPEFEPPWPTDTTFARVSLARLEGNEVDELMAAVLGGGSLPKGVRAEVAERAAGVPLFIEETLKMILEAGSGDPRAIPGTLQNLLTARLDALGDLKELAQLASVAALGGEFSFELLQTVTQSPEATLKESLAELVRAEFLYQRGTASDPVYVFKHALIWEAAYGSLLRSGRRSFHARIARVLEETFPERIEHEPELIAQHLAEAGRMLEAIRYWQQAGERALRAWATEEAATHFERGLELVPLSEDQQTRELELALQLARGTALMAARGYAAPEAKASFARAEALSGEVADPSSLAPALYGLGAFYASTAQPKKACEFGRRLLAVADAQGDEDMLIEANVILAIAEYLKGDPAAAVTSAKQVLARWEPEKHRNHIFAYGQEPGIVAMTMTALAHGWLGRLDEALALADEAEGRGREAGHPLTLAYTLGGDGILYQLVADIEQVERTAAELVTVASEHALPMWLAWGRIMHGWALLQRSQAEEGMAELKVGLEAAEAVHFSVMKIHFLSQLAESFGRLGHVSEGITMLEEGFAALEATDERVSEAELHRSRGFLHLADNGDALAAEACFRHGIDVARRQQALLLELRSVTALAELLVAEGRAGEAQLLLEDVTGRFTQGHGTPVLQNASALLERIGVQT